MGEWGDRRRGIEGGGMWEGSDGSRGGQEEGDGRRGEGGGRGAGGVMGGGGEQGAKVGLGKQIPAWEHSRLAVHGLTTRQ